MIRRNATASAGLAVKCPEYTLEHALDHAQWLS